MNELNKALKMTREKMGEVLRLNKKDLAQAEVCAAAFLGVTA